MFTAGRRVWVAAMCALAILAPGAALADSSAVSERPVVIDPRPDWSSKWARRVCGFAQTLAAYDPSFRGGADAICAFVLGTE